MLRSVKENPPKPNPIEDDPRWAMLMSRDIRADGAFYCSVATTGVYCNPSCTAHPQSPKNIRFHETRADAEAAGLKPCGRCKPDQPSLMERYAAMVSDACSLIDTAATAPDLAALAKSAGLSPHHFHRVFKAVTGVTPKRYAMARRVQRVREHLSSSNTITDAIYEAGFNSNSRFYEKSGDILGMTPTKYRAGGESEDIRFAVGECSLGSILVAASKKGVCAISLGDDAEALLRDLQDRFPQANLIAGDDAFEKITATVIGCVESPGLGLNLPLDLRGTVFQQRVWQALRDIPPGATASYAEIARRIGAPKSVRAVAGACAANPLPIAIPCHRVISANGAASGYRFGIERKRALIAREASAHLERGRLQK